MGLHLRRTRRREAQWPLLARRWFGSGCRISDVGRDLEGEGILLRVSADGDLIWSNRIGGDDADDLSGICLAANGDLVACGLSHLTDEAGVQHADVSVVRPTESGDVVWTRTYGGAKHGRGTSIVALGDADFGAGFVIAVGSSDSAGHGNYDMLLLLINEASEEIRRTYHGSSVYDYAEGLVATPDGGFALAGFADSGSDILDLRLILVDADGRRRALHALGDRRDLDYARGLVQLPDGGFLLAGRTNVLAAPGNDAWIVAATSDAKQDWAHAVGGDGADGLNDLCLSADGEAVAVGYTTSLGSGGYDIMVARIDLSEAP